MRCIPSTVTLHAVLAAAIGLSVASAATADPVAAGAPPVVVDRGIVVHVALDRDLSSGNAAVGTEFPLHVTDDVAANGYVIVKAGAAGLGRVTAVTPAGRGTAGTLAYEFVYVMAIDGKKLRITSTPLALAAKNDPKGEPTMADGAAQAATSAASGQAVAATSDAASNVGPIAGPVTGAVAGSLASSVTSSLFGGPKKGPEAVVSAKTVGTAYVADTVHVASTTKATPAPKPTDDGYAHRR
jgi:hypothetical protein